MTRRGLMGTAPIDYGVGEKLNDPARLDEAALLQPLKWKAPRKVFVCSMTDLFGTWVPAEWLDRIYGVMNECPQHTFIVLTKRPTRMRDYLTGFFTRIVEASKVSHAADMIGIPDSYIDARGFDIIARRMFGHVWTGVTIESDQYAWRANRLRETPATVRWISAEPLLSGLPSLDLTGIDWLVAGGESGPKARPMHPSWPRDLRDRCAASGTAYFFKQHGNYVSSTDCPPDVTNASAIVAVSQDGRFVDERDLQETEHGPLSVRLAPADSVFVMRVGNHKSGRLLDGVEHNAFPAAPGAALAGGG